MAISRMLRIFIQDVRTVGEGGRTAFQAAPVELNHWLLKTSLFVVDLWRQTVVWCLYDQLDSGRTGGRSETKPTNIIARKQ